MAPNHNYRSCGFLVSGQVQGVGFRWWTRREADRLGIRGTVRNLYDGRVEVRAGGSPDAMRLFEAGLHRGPGGARVGGIESFPVRETFPEGFHVTG